MSISRCRLSPVLAFGAGVSLVFVWAAPSTAAEGEGLEEIVVTAQRRAQRLSDVGLTVSALSSDELSNRLLTSMQDFNGAVPGVAVSDYGGYNMINIRGVGLPLLNLGVDSATAVHVNGVYISRVYDGRAGFMDLDRIELLRGPQGTLYGRNATSGSVNLLSRMPTQELDGYVRLTYGNYDNMIAEAAIGGPIGDRLSGRIALRNQEREGYWLNLFDGKHYGDAKTRSARATLRFEALDNLTFTTIVDYHREDDANYVTHFFGQGVPGLPITGMLIGGPGVAVPLDAAGQTINPRLLNVDSIPTNERELWGALLQVDWDINDSVRGKSLTSYRTGEYFWGTDFDATAWSFPSNDRDFSYLQEEEFDQLSQELQVLGDTGRLKWVAGLYYMRENPDPVLYDFGFAPEPFAFGLRAEGQTRSDAYAAFGHGEYAVTDRLNVTAGLRYNYEERRTQGNWTSDGALLSFLPPCLELPDAPFCRQKDAKSFSAFTPTLGVNYRWTDDLMTYAVVSRGFKSGGFATLDLKPAFEPEKILAYEAGVKLRSPNQWLSLDMAAFYYDYADLQITQIIDGFISTINAAESEVYGVELEGRIEPMDGLTVSTAFAYLRARYTEFSAADPAFPELGVQDLSGNTLPLAPEFASNINVNYEIPVGSDKLLNLMLNWNWRDEVYFTEFNLPNAARPAVSTLDAAVRLSRDARHGWYVELWGKNLNDETIISQNFISSGAYGRPRNGQLEPPRTYGASLGVKF